MLENSSVNNTKLIVLLEHLTKDERKELTLWLNSPFHNRSEEVTLLYEGLRKKHLHSGKPIERRSLLKYIGIKTSRSKKEIPPKDSKKLTQTMHLLTNQIQEFMTWKEFKKDEILSRRRLMNNLLERKLFRYVYSNANKAQKIHDSSPYRDSQYCEEAYQLAEMNLYLSILTNNRSLKAQTQNVIDSLRQTYIAKMLPYYCSAINSQKILNTSYDYPLMHSLIQHLDNHQEDMKISGIQGYYRLLKLLLNEQPDDYQTLKTYLFSHLNEFNVTTLRQFFAFMTNYCTWQISSGNKDFLLEKHEVYEKGLDLKCWSAGIYFSEHQFVNIVKSALSLNKTDWTNQFITDYHSMMNPEVSNSIACYCNALLAFQNQKFDLAQEYLSKIQVAKDFLYHLDFKILIVKIYHDSQSLSIENIEDHPINYELEAIRQYVLTSNNRKMSEYVRKMFKNFVNVYKRVLDRKKRLIIGLSVSEESVRKLETELPNISPLTEREWLEEKISELVLVRS